MKYLFPFLFISAQAMDISPDIVMVCHPVKLIRHGKSKSFPVLPHDYIHYTNPELTIDIPQEQIRDITNEDKKSNGKCCTPTRCVVAGSICTAISGVMIAIVTATVTLIIHFTTK